MINFGYTSTGEAQNIQINNAETHNLKFNENIGFANNDNYVHLFCNNKSNILHINKLTRYVFPRKDPDLRPEWHSKTRSPANILRDLVDLSLDKLNSKESKTKPN